MKRLLAPFLLLSLAACGGRRHTSGGGPPATPTVTPPAASARVLLSELRDRQRDAAKRLKAQYPSTQNAMNEARGGKPGMTGMNGSGRWDCAYAAHAYYAGDAATKADAKAYYRRWYEEEPDNPGNTCSSNWQLVRQVGLYFGQAILGQAEALRINGNTPKVTRARQNTIDLLRGQWLDFGGVPIPSGPCSGHGQSLGDEPEGYRSRHYAPRFWMYVWALADHAPDADVRAAAVVELDKAVAHMRGGVGPHGIWDEKLLPHFRSTTKGTPTGTRCPQECPSGMKAHRLTCGPGETFVLSHILFGSEWCDHFDGQHAPCDSQADRALFWMDYPYVAGAGWTPLVK